MMKSNLFADFLSAEVDSTSDMMSVRNSTVQDDVSSMIERHTNTLREDYFTKVRALQYSMYYEKLLVVKERFDQGKKIDNSLVYYILDKLDTCHKRRHDPSPHLHVVMAFKFMIYGFKDMYLTRNDVETMASVSYNFYYEKVLDAASKSDLVSEFDVVKGAEDKIEMKAYSSYKFLNKEDKNWRDLHYDMREKRERVTKEVYSKLASGHSVYEFVFDMYVLLASDNRTFLSETIWARYIKYFDSLMNGNEVTFGDIGIHKVFLYMTLFLREDYIGKYILSRNAWLENVELDDIQLRKFSSTDAIKVGDSVRHLKYFEKYKFLMSGTKNKEMRKYVYREYLDYRERILSLSDLEKLVLSFSLTNSETESMVQMAVSFAFDLKPKLSTLKESVAESVSNMMKDLEMYPYVCEKGGSMLEGDVLSTFMCIKISNVIVDFLRLSRKVPKKIKQLNERATLLYVLDRVKTDARYSAYFQTKLDPYSVDDAVRLLSEKQDLGALKQDVEQRIDDILGDSQLGDMALLESIRSDKIYDDVPSITVTTDGLGLDGLDSAMYRLKKDILQ